MNRNIIFLFCIYITVLNIRAKAQDVNFDKEQVINTILETININDEDQLDEAYISELKDNINYYLNNPININTATRSDFEKLVFISPIYINAIINYRQENGNFKNINELNFIDIIDDNTLDLIKHFFTLIKDPEKKFDLFRAIKNSKQEFFSSYYQTLKRAYGYNIKNGYLGPNFGFRTFYRISSPRYIYGNIQVNNAPGAPFGKGSFTSGYVLIKNTGVLKSLHIGDYQLQFGQGLVFWGGYSLNKSYDPINIIKSPQEDVLYNSSLTYGFNRGVTVLLEKNKFSVRPFFSYRGIDANLTWSNNDYKITSISSNSYYRTKSEIETRNSAHELAAGLSVGYRINPEFNVSMLVSSLSYSHDFFHLTYPYKLFQNYDRNKNYISLASDYQRKNYMIFGEVSTLNFKETAILLGSTAVLNPKVILGILYRNFSRGYSSPYANPISESSTYNDESGLYWGLKLIFNKQLQFSIFLDTFKFSWLKYQVDSPSDGMEIGSLLTYSPFKYLSNSIKYRYKTKAFNNTTSAVSTVDYYKKHSLELTNMFKINDDIIVKTYVEASQYNKETGVYLGQELQFKLFTKTILALRYGIFSTESYDSRIYISEYFIPYSWPFVTLYDKGSRLSIFAKHGLSDKINVYLLYSAISYKDMTNIGSWLSEIKGNTKPYIKLQLIYNIQ